MKPEDQINAFKSVVDGMLARRGGSRPNSGRPKKAPTVVLTFRVREDQVEQIKKTVKKITDTIQVGKTR